MNVLIVLTRGLFKPAPATMAIAQQLRSVLADHGHRAEVLDLALADLGASGAATLSCLDLRRNGAGEPIERIIALDPLAGQLDHDHLVTWLSTVEPSVSDERLTPASACREGSEVLSWPTNGAAPGPEDPQCTLVEGFEPPTMADRDGWSRVCRSLLAAPVNANDSVEQTR